jgi:CBS domain-containing protein
MGATTVADAMTTAVLTLAAATPIDEAICAMREAGVGSLLVIDSECSPEGIFTSTDAMQAAADDRSASGVTVEEYMTTDVHTTHSDTSLEAVTEEMIEREIDHLPVVDQEGNVTGILTTTDLVDHLSIEGSEQAAQVG